MNRLNLHVVHLAASHGGCIIVDSTRKGKRYPDSFSRTIPIWCATINKTVYNFRTRSNIPCEDWDLAVHTPPQTVSPTELHQIEALVEGFVAALESSGVDIVALSRDLDKPLRPIWMHQDSLIWSNCIPRPSELPFVSVICLSASRVCGASDIETDYVQGAGDDEECWARSLTPELFWAYRGLIMEGGEGSPEGGIEARVDQVVRDARMSTVNIAAGAEAGAGDASGASAPWVRLGSTCIYLAQGFPTGPGGDVAATLWSTFSGVLNCSGLVYEGIDPTGEMAQAGRYLHLRVSATKIAKYELESILALAEAFVLEHVLARGGTVLVHSVAGYDVPVCIAQAVITKYMNEGGSLCDTTQSDPVDKEDIRRAHVFVEGHLPQCLPPRDLRGAVNRYLMTPPELRNPEKNCKKQQPS
eukprot:TRINITY_DN9216_c1_g1_i2.p1 TRINITY_DN9216_c1_g1~~TRINITY_DN9216_c1_g1_i2.p1  ORF type:complete len:415 (+),score=99.30 TRINITY_DN9216_c1_g1_i2:280-1524(+)